MGQNMAELVVCPSPSNLDRPHTHLLEALRTVLPKAPKIKRAFFIAEDAPTAELCDKAIAEGFSHVAAHAPISSRDYVFIDRTREAGNIRSRTDFFAQLAASANISLRNVIYASQNPKAALEEEAQGPRWLFFHHFCISMSRAYRDFSIMTPPVECDGTVLCMNNKPRPHRFALAIAAREICGDRLELSWGEHVRGHSRARAAKVFRRDFPSMHHANLDIPSRLLEPTTRGHNAHPPLEPVGLPREHALRAFLHLVPETNYSLGVDRFTEKILKAVLAERPFLVFGSPNILKTFRSFGFKTFSENFSEDYDDIFEHEARLNAILRTLKNLLARDFHEVLSDCADVCAYNARHLRAGLEDAVMAKFSQQLIALAR